MFFYKKKLTFFDVIFLEKHNSKLECLNFLIELKILITTNTKKITKKKYDSFYDKKNISHNLIYTSQKNKNIKQ